ncbi:hypothetical protein, partial [Candidatus Aquicultor secundus]|uniref:hypothetical protein n=1 Tax=Candidatus Aquicultor secundus TaxID=1973895 RepID=UPI00257FA2A4
KSYPALKGHGFFNHHISDKLRPTSLNFGYDKGTTGRPGCLALPMSFDFVKLAMLNLWGW